MMGYGDCMKGHVSTRGSKNVLLEEAVVVCKVNCTSAFFYIVAA